MFEDINAVIFDMDGTIIDSMWVWRKIDEDFLRKRNIDAPSNIQKQIEGMSFTETAQYFKNKFSLNDEIDDIKNEWIDMVKYYYEKIIPLKDGVLEFISYLKVNNIKIGLATSNSRELTELILKRTGIYESFDTIITSCEVGKDKSFPDIFITAANQMGVDPSKCIVFEDSLVAVQGAKKAGMKVIAVYDEHSDIYQEELSRSADKYIMGFKAIA